MQNRLDHLVDELDHLDESFANHSYENTLSEQGEGNLSWLDADDHGMQQDSDMPHADYSTDMFEGETHGRRPFKFLFGLFAVSTSLVLALLWFFWPNTADINISGSQSVTQSDVKAAPTPPAASDESDESAAVAQSSPRPVESNPATVVSQGEPSPASSPIVAGAPEAELNNAETTSNAEPLAAETVQSQQQPPEDIQPATANTAVEKEEQSQLLTVVVHLGLIRDAPGVQGKVVARLKKGTVVLSLFRQGDWYRVRFPDGREMWGNKAIFTVAPDEPAEKTTGQASGFDTVIPVTASQSITATDQTGAKTPEPASAIDVQPAAALPEVKTGTVEQRRVLTVSVHLGIIRDAPGKDGKVVARLKQGTPVMTLSRQGEWYRVLLAGHEAWAHQSIF